MTNKKILQIIPAPQDLYARYLCDGSSCSDKVSCIALVEDEDELGKYNEVKAMVLGGGSDFLFPDEAVNFVELFHKEEII